VDAPVLFHDQRLLIANYLLQKRKIHIINIGNANISHIFTLPMWGFVILPFSGIVKIKSKSLFLLICYQVWV